MTSMTRDAMIAPCGRCGGFRGRDAITGMTRNYRVMDLAEDLLCEHFLDFWSIPIDDDELAFRNLQN